MWSENNSPNSTQCGWSYQVFLPTLWLYLSGPQHTNQSPNIQWSHWTSESFFCMIQSPNDDTSLYESLHLDNRCFNTDNACCLLQWSSAQKGNNNTMNSSFSLPDHVLKCWTSICDVNVIHWHHLVTNTTLKRLVSTLHLHSTRAINAVTLLLAKEALCATLQYM